jgi:hypothetical protein
MLKKVIVAGLLGWVVLFAWSMLTNGMLGLNSSINMKRIPNDRLVYEVLRQSIFEPGGYVLPHGPQEAASSGNAWGEEPLFSVHYTGMGHESAGKEFLVHLAVALVAPMIVAWMLSLTSERTLASYSRKVMFVAAVGISMAVYGDIARFGLTTHTMPHALLFAAQTFLAWLLAGLVMAWRVKLS